MTKQTLVILSVIADLLDLFVVGQIPGLSWIVDIPLILMHVSFAGSKGWLTMLEIIPLAGTFPVFTIAGMLYGHQPQQADRPLEMSVVEVPPRETPEDDETLLIPCLEETSEP